VRAQTVRKYIANNFMTKLDHGTYPVVPERPTADNLLELLQADNSYRYTRDENGKRKAMRIFFTGVRKGWDEMERLGVCIGKPSINMSLKSVLVLRKCISVAALLPPFRTDDALKDAQLDFEINGTPDTITVAHVRHRAPDASACACGCFFCRSRVGRTHAGSGKSKRKPGRQHGEHRKTEEKRQALQDMCVGRVGLAGGEGVRVASRYMAKMRGSNEAQSRGKSSWWKCKDGFYRLTKEHNEEDLQPLSRRNFKALQEMVKQEGAQKGAQQQAAFKHRAELEAAEEDADTDEDVGQEDVEMKDAGECADAGANAEYVSVFKRRESPGDVLLTTAKEAVARMRAEELHAVINTMPHLNRACRFLF